MLKLPSKEKGEVFDHFVQSIDLFQTILRLFNFDGLKNDGIDLYPNFNIKNRNFVFAEALEENEIMVRSKKYSFKVLKRDNAFKMAIFDILKNPKESKDLFEEEKEKAEKFLEFTNLFLKDKIISRSRENISEEEIKKLKSLGYLY